MNELGTIHTGPVAPLTTAAIGRRDALRREVTEAPPAEVSPDELNAHFSVMVPRYWQNISADQIRWHLSVLHRFLSRTANTQKSAALALVESRPAARSELTEVLVCTWDRPGLLAQLAGYFSALRLNVRRAEVYTRADNVVLDCFWVSEENGSAVTRTDVFKQLEFLLEGGLSEPPRFASTWALESHKAVAQPRAYIPHITFNTEDSPYTTTIRVLAGERLGLLHDILVVFNRHELNICDAIIETVADVAQDTFLVTDREHRPVQDAAKLREIARELEAAL